MSTKASILSDRTIDTPVGMVYLSTIETEDHQIKVQATMIQEYVVTTHDPLYAKSKIDLVKEAEAKAVRGLLSTVVVPRDLLKIAGSLNVLLMECIITHPASPLLEDIKLKRMDLTDQLGLLQEIARGAYVDTRPADDKG
jgi:hypothetical protein